VPLVADAILLRNVAQVELPAKRVRPARTTVGTSVVISRANRVLTLYREERKVKTFRVAVGTSRYPTPGGLFAIVQMQRNPTWIPPDSSWAKGLGPIPPGPGNPLGTRWMGTSAPAVGIHGTYASSSIGTAASHGCIRMYIRDAEWLYERVRAGTPVLIR
jgi:lipoprotein-anchoring transpeptidase ErfK/SrfK